jgi:zinc protease
MKKNIIIKCTSMIFLWVILFYCFTVQASKVPPNPDALTYAQLDFKPPEASDYRVELEAGPVVYMVPDRERPLINISIAVRTGTYNDPEGKEGLAAMMGYLLANSGSEDRFAEEMDEKFSFLAAQLYSAVGETRGSINLNLLSKDVDEGLELLRELLTQPGFKKSRVDLYKQQKIELMKKRNDDSKVIEGMELLRLAYGDHFFRNRLPTKSSIESITIKDLKKFHQQWFYPNNFVVAVSGDFDKNAMTQKLNHLFANWPYSSDQLNAVPTDKKFSESGIYFYDKKEVNQGRVAILLPGIKRDNPDYYAVTVMNKILGGGGFTSRIVNRIRTEEGLAYSAYSLFPGGVYFPRTFVAAFQSKSNTVLYATDLLLKELRRMSKEVVSDLEIDTAKASLIQTFPQQFQTKTAIAARFVDEAFTGRLSYNPNYFNEYRQKMESVTQEDVKRVAKKYLNLDNLVILVVGDKESILKGHPDHPVDIEKGADKQFDIKPRDPLTLQVLK